MIDEAALRRDVSRASRAQKLIDDELLNGAFATLEQTYMEAWRATHIHDAAAREKLFLAVNILGKVRDHLAKVVSDGTLAHKELERIATEVERAAEQRKRWGGII